VEEAEEELVINGNDDIPVRLANGNGHAVNGYHPRKSWPMPRTKTSLPQLSPKTDATNYLLSRILTADDIRAPASLVHRLNGNHTGQTAEVIYLLRPLVYALLLKRASSKKAWHPIIVAFLMEYGSLRLLKRYYRNAAPGGLKGLTKLEREELSKRGWQLWWYFLRGGVYENVSRVVLDRFVEKSSNKPVIGLVGSVVSDFQYLLDHYYFSTSTL